MQRASQLYKSSLVASANGREPLLLKRFRISCVRSGRARCNHSNAVQRAFVGDDPALESAMYPLQLLSASLLTYWSILPWAMSLSREEFKHICQTIGGRRTTVDKATLYSAICCAGKSIIRSHLDNLWPTETGERLLHLNKVFINLSDIVSILQFYKR